jgi:hypothetical protein
MAISMEPRKVSQSALPKKVYDDVSSDASTKFDDEPLMVALPDYTSECWKSPKEFSDGSLIGDEEGAPKDLVKVLEQENRRLEEQNALLQMQYSSYLQLASQSLLAPYAMAMSGYYSPGLQQPGLQNAAPLVPMSGQPNFSLPQVCIPPAQQPSKPRQHGKIATRNVANVDADADLEFDGDCSGDADAAQGATRTSVMLCNLPNSYTRQMLAKLLDEEGFAGTYDFVYMPIDFKSRLSLAYAFINLVSAKDAKRFWKVFHGYSNWAVPSHKVARVNWSEVQGLVSNIDRYRNSPVMHEAVPDEFKPAVFSGSERISFPAPTGKIWAPRRRVMPAKAVTPGRVA